MRSFSRPRCLVAAAAVALLAGVLPAISGSVFFSSPKLKERKGDTSCHAQAVRDLELFSPRGAQVFHALSDRSMFWPFLTCDNVALGLSTAVHESVHGLTEQLDGYPLIHGGVLKRPHEVERFFPPRLIAARFDRDNIFVQNYLLPGAASSADTLMFLFDELNAYTHDLHTAVRIRSLPGGNVQVDHRDGLASLMRFMMHYADDARARHPETWRGLNAPRVRNVVRTLWSQAEQTLGAACGIPRFGGEDHRYAAEMCDRKNSAALGEILGRAVVCQRRCLNRPDDGSDARFEVADATADVSSVSGGTVAGRAGRAAGVSLPRSARATPPRGLLVATASRPARWPVVVTRPVTLAAGRGEPALARFASPVQLLAPRLIAAPMLVRHIE